MPRITRRRRGGPGAGHGGVSARAGWLVVMALALVVQPGCRWRHHEGYADANALEVARYRVTEAQSRGQTYVVAEIVNPTGLPMGGATVTAALQGPSGEDLGSQARVVPRLKAGERCVISFAISSPGKHKNVSFHFAPPQPRGRAPRSPAGNGALPPVN